MNLGRNTAFILIKDVHRENPSSMKVQKSLEKGEIDSSSSERGRRRSEEIVPQIWTKKRRNEYNDASTMEKGKRREIEILLINNDVLEEIMLRLPVKTLVRFQIVSKHCMRTITSSSFKERHLLHEKTLGPKILFLYEDKNGSDGNNLTLKTMRLDWSSSSSTCLVEEGPVRHIEPQNKKSDKAYSSCDGLLCIFDIDILTTPILVTNPATGQSQFLPLSSIQQQYIDKNMPLPEVFPIPGFGKDSVTGTYKLVWLHDNKSNNISPYEVFDFDVKKWRYVTMDTPYELLPHRGPIFAKGGLYWVNKNQTILAYNLHTEMFKVITHRILSQATWAGFISMCSLNDCLWITDMKGDDNGIQDFWRIKNVLELEWEWEKMFSIDSTLISPFFPDISCPLSILTLMATSKDNKEVLLSKFCSSKVFKLFLHPTSLVFHSVFCGPYGSEFIPYFQSLDFPL